MLEENGSTEFNNYNKENLKELSDKIREIYCKKLEEKMTGKPSIDRPWEYFYDYDRDEEIPKMTIYDKLYENNKDDLDDLAIIYYGAKYNYGTLLKKIDEAAKSFKTLGVESDDKVTICMPTIPETIYSFYALGKIGAVSNMMSPMFDPKQMIERINETESKTLVILDQFYPLLKDVIAKTCIENIIVVPATNSALLCSPNESTYFEEDNGYMNWNNFIKNGKSYEGNLYNSYEENKPVTIVYSSGTTGESKGIVLSHDSFNNSIDAYSKSGMDLSRRQSFLQTIPGWFSTGLCTSLHLPLCNGIHVILEPNFDKDVFVDNVIKYKPNFSVAVPGFYEALLNNSKVDGIDFSFFRFPFVGGEPLRTKKEILLNAFFEAHNFEQAIQMKIQIKIQIGYGQCEGGACITTTVGRWHKPYESVGKPLPGVIVSAFDPETGEELNYYEKGEIRACTPARMLGYFNNEEETNKYFHTDEKGNIWNCTGDIGYVDRQGNVFICGRMSDYIIDLNSNRKYLFDLRDEILNYESVQSCEIVGIDVDDSDYQISNYYKILKSGYEEDEIIDRGLLDYTGLKEYNFQYPINYGMLKNGYEEDEEILDHINKPNRQIPVAYVMLNNGYENNEEIIRELLNCVDSEGSKILAVKFINEFPVTKAGKRDKSQLKNEINDYYKVNEETDEIIKFNLNGYGQYEFKDKGNCKVMKL